MTFEAYRIAVRISLIDATAAGLMTLSRGLMRAQRDADGLQGRLDRLRKTALVGAAASGAGIFGLSMFAKMLRPAEQYAHQLALMNTAGMKHLEIVKATQAAWAANKTTPTSSVTESMAAIRDLRMVFGDTGHAIQFMPAVQKAQAVLQSLRFGEAGAAHAEAYEMAKALEMKGAVRTPEQFMGQANMMTKALVATGGKVSASDFLSAFKYGRAATSGWSDDFTYKILPTLIQEMKTRGGSGGATGGPGSALMSAYAAVVGGTVPQKALQVWNKLGLLDPSKVVWTKDGHAKGVGPGGIMGSEQFQQNPYQWAQTFLVPALKRAGYQTEEQQKQALQYLFPNRTAGFVMSQFVTQAWKFERDKRLIGQAQGIDAYQSLLKTDPVTAHRALASAWDSFLTSLSINAVPIIVPALIELSKGLNHLGEFARRHPNLTKDLVLGFGGLAGVLAIGGPIVTGLALVRFAFGGLAGVLGASGGGATGGGLIGSIGSLAGGLKVLGAAVAPLLAILAVKNWAEDTSHDQQRVSTLRGWSNTLKGWLPNWMGDPTSRARDRYLAARGELDGTGGDYVRSRPGAAGGGNMVMKMDGRTVAEIVSGHQAKDAGGPLGGATRFDSRMALPSPALNTR